MLHLRATSAPSLTDILVAEVRRHPAVAHVLVDRGRSVVPPGDVIELDVAREGASDVIDLCRARLGSESAVVVTPIDVAISAHADAAEARMPGLGTDAVVWQEIEERTGEDTYLSNTFCAFMVISMFIAAIGLLLDSPILIVGAMVVGPDFGPVAALCVGVVRRRWAMVRRAAVAVVAGLSLGVLSTVAFVWLLSSVGIFGVAELIAPRPMTAFISKPDALSAVVAVIAGVAGMLSLTSSKSGALIGVLISVTTIPAAACVAVGAAYGQWGIARGALVQLLINLVCMMVAGLLTLIVQREWERHVLFPRRPQV